MRNQIMSRDNIYQVKRVQSRRLFYVIVKSYFEEEPGTPNRAAKLLTRDEARRIAANIAKLPGLLHKG